MKDLSDSFFKFNKSFSSEEYKNRKENSPEQHKEKEVEKDNTSEQKPESSDINSAPTEIKVKQRKILTQWLDAEYNSAFQYKKVNAKPINGIVTNPVYYNNSDINDPLVIYEHLKKYTTVLYDFNCSKDIENTIISELEKELKEYYKHNNIAGLEEHLDDIFEKLKEKFLRVNNNPFSSQS